MHFMTFIITANPSLGSFVPCNNELLSVEDSTVESLSLKFLVSLAKLIYEVSMKS